MRTAASNAVKGTQSKQAVTTVVEQTNDGGEQTTILYGDDVIQLPQWWMDNTPHDTMYLFETERRNDYEEQQRHEGDKRDEDDEFVRQMYAVSA